MPSGGGTRVSSTTTTAMPRRLVGRLCACAAKGIYKKCGHLTTSPPAPIVSKPCIRRIGMPQSFSCVSGSGNSHYVQWECLQGGWSHDNNGSTYHLKRRKERKYAATKEGCPYPGRTAQAGPCPERQDGLPHWG